MSSLQMIDLNMCYHQLEKVKVEVDKKHPDLFKTKDMIFHQDNASRHIG